MKDEEWELMIRKKRKLRELSRAKARVRQLERELRGESVRQEDALYVPEFLRPTAATAQANARSWGDGDFRVRESGVSSPLPPDLYRRTDKAYKLDSKTWRDEETRRA